MWQHVKTTLKFSRRWHTACSILFVFYALCLILLPFMAKSPPFEGNLWNTVGLFVFVALNVPIASYLQTSLQIWEMYVGMGERLNVQYKTTEV